MTDEEIRMGTLERKAGLLSMVTNAIRCSPASGYTTLDDILKFIEKENKSIEEWQDLNSED